VSQLLIKTGETWSPVMTFARAGVATQVDLPVLEIREGQDSTFPLILRCDETHYITQTTAGVLIFNVPYTVTGALTPGEWYWDMYGIIDGSRKCLAPVDRAIIAASVSVP
jgi:hypothetical protein